MEFELEEIPLKVVSPTLRQDLANIYPDATSEELDKYEELVKTYDTEKLPPTKEAIRYKVLYKQIKALEDEKDALRLELLKQYKLLNHQLGDVTIIESGGETFDMNRLYDWVSSNLEGELLDYVTIKSVDDKKFTQLILEKKISYDDLPRDLYIEKKKSYKVEIEGARSRKK